MSELPKGQEKIWDYFQNEGVDSFSQNAGRLEFLVRQLRSGTCVLNVGVGNGAFEQMAIKAGMDVWSLDPSERAIEKLRTAMGLGDKAQAGYGQAMPFPDDQFDAVVMSEILEHLDDDVVNMTLGEVRRVLRSSGIFIGTVPARERLEDSMVVCPNCNERFHRWGHKRSFEIESLSRLLSECFFVEIAEEHFFVPWDSVPLTEKAKGLIKKFLSWQRIGTYGICRNIYFLAKKKAS